MFSKQLIADSRFGLGVRADQLDWSSTENIGNLRSKLISSLNEQGVVSFTNNLPSSNEIGKGYAKFNKKKSSLKKEFRRLNANSTPTQKQLDKQAEQLSALQKSYKGQKAYLAQTSYVLKQAIYSKHSIHWRLFDFFSNHFSVTANGGIMKSLAVTLEMEAIAPHLFDSFENMLLAVCQHPAMILYLNNEKSFGPNSKLAKKRKSLGLNENLAREILELHTLGVNGGYKQSDVTELAKAITGWSLTNPSKSSEFVFHYRHQGHEPGIRTVLGKKYPARKEQGVSILKDLANHPATAEFVSRKLVAHFVSDVPNEELVNDLKNTWLKTKGNLKAVMTTLISSDLSWLPERQKFKTPREYLISALRLLDSTNTVKNINVQKLKDRQLINWLNQMGQKPFSAGSPAGFPDTESDWNGANALMSRIDWINLLTRKVRVNLDKAITLVFGEDKSSDNYLRIVRAESKQQALALLLLSPEFMRR